MDEPRMQPAEEALEDAFHESVRAEKARRGSLERLREAVLSTIGRDVTRWDVERARAGEDEHAADEPPRLPE
jgi:hypothetical protein